MDEPTLPGPRQVSDLLHTDIPPLIGPSVGVPPADIGCALLRWSRGRPRVLLTGDIDFSCAAQIHALGRMLTRHRLDGAASSAVSGAVDAEVGGAVEAVEVDAAGVTFLDVAGLRALLALGGEDQRVVVVRPSRCVLYLVTVLARCGAGLSLQMLAGMPDAVVISGVPGR